MGMMTVWWFGIALGWAEEHPDPTGMIAVQGANQVPAFFIDRFEYPNQEGVMPKGGLSLADAQSLCVSVGKRLCTAAEWRQACLGSQNHRYAYGDEPISGTCHQSPNQANTHTSMISNAQFVPSGTFSDCKTSDGVVDMIGNLEEWVLDDWKGMGGMLEGGASYTHESYADCTGRYSRMPDYRLTTDQQIVSAGARCCWSETPLTKELIALDSQRRLKPQVRETVEYEASNEVALPTGGWIDRFEYPNREGSMPLTGLTWFEATERCETVGKRLCSVYEWEQACAEGGQAFSMGGSYIKGGCALELDEPVPSGTMRTCQTVSGVQDMSGSVWEWTSDGFEASILSVGLPPEMQALAEIRGGSSMVEAQKGLCRPSDGYPVTSKNMGYEDLGFRCCRGEQASVQGLAWGGKTCPQEMVGIGGFCMDRFEYPNVQGAVPTGSLSFADAQSQCANQGKRLCIESEWTLACEGPEWKGYPYGSTYQSGTCALKDRSLGVGGQVLASGDKEGCQTPDGVFDLSGNLWEWVALDTGDGGVLRGGGSLLSAGLGRCRSRAFSTQATQQTDVGTRCCLDAQ